MVFYFTGTGNSRWVAKQLEATFGGALIAVADELKQKKAEYRYLLQKDEYVFFVFPVHSWGPSLPILRFIKRLTLEAYAGQPIYTVCTCGDECGYTDKIMRKALFKRNLLLSGAYSVQMPNNYILMNINMFDTDPREVEEAKLLQAPMRLDAIREAIRNGHGDGLYTTGPASVLKSQLIYPLFTAFASHVSFRAIDNVCTSCGLCARICPTGTITMENGRPEWGKHCVQCSACIHRCPARAIEYGHTTWKKGRYHHPDI